MWRVLEDAGLLAEIEALPDGLDTMLGERGHTLSGGQRARLSLARSLLRNRPIYLLDDPLSSVDTHGEALILENLSRISNGRTNLIVSHRPLSIAFSSKIFVLDGGGLAAQGSHGELIESSDQYRHLVRAQQLTVQAGGA
jgi:ATP-binding cassette subfamily B protein